MGETQVGFHGFTPVAGIGILANPTTVTLAKRLYLDVSEPHPLGFGLQGDVAVRKFEIRALSK